MSLFRATQALRCALAAFVLLAAARAGWAAGSLDPLFGSDEMLELTIEAPFSQIMRDRPEEDEVAGVLRYVDVDGTPVELDIGIRTRGKFRLNKRVCPFAPLRVNFRKSQLDGTLFAGQDKLKLVTHCETRSRAYEQTVVTEYLAYRIFNVMTDLSYRVRLARINYQYTDRRRSTTKYAFFIERDDRLANRIGRPLHVTDRFRVAQLDAEHLNLSSVFQYLIGNTDFSPVAAASGQDCCHNYTLFGIEGEPMLAIPYDFDQSGLVDAPHAAPNPRFHLASVKQRVYRGRCVNNSLLERTLAAYLEKRGEIEALVTNLPQLATPERRSTASYIRSFFRTIGNPKNVDRHLIKKCN